MRLVHASIDWPGTWEQVMPHLSKAMAEGMYRDWTLEQVREQVLAGLWGLYGVVDDEGQVIGAGVVTVAVTGRRRALEVLLFGAIASTHTWRDLLAPLKDLARSMDCSVLKGQGRPGWARALEGATAIACFEVDCGTA